MACADAAVTVIRLAATNADTNQDFTFIFPCDAGQAVTPGVTVGSYAISVDALDAAGGARATAQWMFDNRDSSDLKLVIFPVSRSG